MGTFNDPCSYRSPFGTTQDILGDGTRVLERQVLPDLVNPMVIEMIALGCLTSGDIFWDVEPANIVIIYYPLVNVYITMENHHAINGKKPLFRLGHFQ
jgi:hypothetical protein